MFVMHNPQPYDNNLEEWRNEHNTRNMVTVLHVKGWADAVYL